MNRSSAFDRAAKSSSSSSSFLALGCVGLLASASSVAAQTTEAAKPAKIGGVTVIDTAIDEGSYKVERQASPKSTAPLLDTPRSVTVIPNQLIRDTASATLADALRTVPGITMGAGEGGNPLGDRPFIRGFDSQASTFLDGVRDVGAQSREVFAIEQIEVVKGSDSATGGRGGAGGTINLISKVPTSERFVAVTGSAGNANYKRVTVDINQPINEFVGVRLNGMWHDQDIAGRDAVFSKRWGIAPSIKIGMTGPTSLTLSYYHLETDELPDSGIPYLYTIGNAPVGVTETGPATNFTTIGGKAVSVPRGAFYGLADRDFRKTKVDNATARVEHDFGGVTLRNTARYGRSEQNYIWTQPDDQQGNVYGTSAASPDTAGGQVWRRINNRYGFAEGIINQTDLFGTFNTGSIKHSFAVSAEFSNERAQNGSYVSNTATGAVISTGSTITPRCTPAMIARYNCTSVDNPNSNDPWQSYASDTSTALASIQKSLYQTRTLTETDTKAGSVFDTITINDKLLVNLGLRFDNYDTIVSPGVPVTSTAARSYFKREDNIWTYQAGVMFKPVANASLYASTSSAATPPGTFLAQGAEGNALNTTSQTLTDALKVEKTKSYEIGGKIDLFDGQLALTLAGFRTQTQNARTTGENGLVVFVGERRINGIEFGANGNITPEWNVFGGYTYMDAKIIDGGITTTTVNGVAYFAPSVNTGKQFPNTPKHSLTVFSNYKVTRDLTIGGGAMYMSKVYGGYSDTRVVNNGVVVITRELARFAPGYWRFDANASYKITDAIGIQANVLNVANKRYFDKAYQAHYANQAAGRTAIVSLNVKY